MFFGLVLITTLVCIPGIVFMLHSENRILSSSEDEDIPLHIRVLIHIFTVLFFSVTGSFFASKASLVDPFLTSLIRLNLDVHSFTHSITTGITYGFVCSIVNILFYYFFLKKALDSASFLKIETHYRNMGIGTRIFYGGFIEEIIFRWSIMSFLIWIGNLFFQNGNPIVFWIAILISSLLFAFAHIPGIGSMGITKSPIIIGYALVGNIWVGICTGLAFLHGGLFAAIIVHILFHLVWYPLQIQTRA